MSYSVPLILSVAASLLLSTSRRGDLKDRGSSDRSLALDGAADRGAQGGQYIHRHADEPERDLEGTFGNDGGAEVCFHMDGGLFVDTLTMSSGKETMKGKNQAGKPISATKLK